MGKCRSIIGISAFLISFQVVQSQTPTIFTQPQSKSVLLYQPVIFSVTASGGFPLSYQWRKNGLSIPNATSSQLLISHTQLTDQGNYTVRVSSPQGFTISSNASLAISLPIGGDIDFTFNYQSASHGQVIAMALQPDEKVLIGGAFTRYIARLNSDGTTDQTFMDSLTGPDNSVNCVAYQNDNKILIGGNFLHVNGESKNYIARLSAGGLIDPEFQNGEVGCDSTVNSITLQEDGRIIIAGNFGNVNGVGRSKIARINSDGSIDNSFDPGQGVNGPVNVTAVQEDGKIVIGGRFTSIDNIKRYGIGRLNTNGTVDVGFQNGLAGVTNLALPTVRAIAIQPDGKVLISGSFTNVNGIARNNFARLNTDGTLDAAFLDGETGASAEVDCLAVQNDGKILLGGVFTNVNGSLRGRMARLMTDGSLDPDFASGLAGANISVSTLILEPGGKILMGGGFTTLNGVSSLPAARVWPVAPPILINASFENDGVNLMWYGISNRSYRVQYVSEFPASAWFDVAGDVYSTGNIVTKIDPTPPVSGQRFYRVRLLP